MSGIHEVFPYLRLSDAPRAIEYYKQAFGAVEQFRLVEPGGRVGHAQLDFGGTTIMLSDEFPERDDRRRRWFRPRKAATRVAEPELRALLEGFASANLSDPGKGKA